MHAEQRFKLLAAIQHHYPEFVDFCEDLFSWLGFSMSPIQREIAEFMQYGGQDIMVQAQRGQAKSTIAIAFAAWTLVHAPAARAITVSAGEKQAKDIAYMTVRIFEEWDILECMRPDTRSRKGVDAYDLHADLKGVDKSPSITCFGSLANLQGPRADLLIADDLESRKNSETEHLREKLLQISRDFASVVGDGKTVWLGTPQLSDSLYNTLPDRGCNVRIWPGRYPTPAQIGFYGDLLAPSIKKAILKDPSLQIGGGEGGDQGQPTDERFGEAKLQSIERKQGTPFFQLQHMLTTQLTDATRYPLKMRQIIILAPVGIRSEWPVSVTRGMLDQHVRQVVQPYGTYTFSKASHVSDIREKFTRVITAIDPAAGGANGDATAAVTMGTVNSMLYVLGVNAVPGGYNEETLRRLAQMLQAYYPDSLVVEKNMGYGAYAVQFLPIARQYLGDSLGFSEPMSKGRKETRIIGTLAPLLGRAGLVISEDVLEQDARVVSELGNKTYSLFHQLSRITERSGALKHDDALDALSIGASELLPALSWSPEQRLQEERGALMQAWIHRALGLPAQVAEPTTILSHRK